MLEKSSKGFSAFSPDAPSCITVGDTVELTIDHMREAMEIYIEEIAESGIELPKGKGVEYHIKEEVAKKGSLSNEYLLTQIEIDLPDMA